MAFFIALASPAPGDEPASNLAVNEKLRLFNPEIFGKTPSDPVTILLPGLQGIQPKYIQVDLQDGRYSAALITYGKIDFEVARRSLNDRYKKFEKALFANDPELALWRNTEGRYAIQLSTDDEEHKVRIAYIHFDQSPTVILEAMKKAGAFDTP
jgi:hypothetical protein